LEEYEGLAALIRSMEKRVIKQRRVLLRLEDTILVREFEGHYYDECEQIYQRASSSPPSSPPSSPSSCAVSIPASPDAHQVAECG